MLSFCFAASVSCAQMVEASSRGPWTVLTFCDIFVKLNDTTLFVAQYLTPFAASCDFCGKL